MTTPDTHALLDTARRAAHAAGQVAAARWGDPGTVKLKGFRDIVTEVDVAAQATAEAIIHADFPDHAILGEESGAGAEALITAGYQWIIDPIDGTTNFARGYPCFSAAIALCYDGQPLVGAVDDALHDHHFSGALGLGAWLVAGTAAPRPLRVTPTTTLASALVGFDWARDPAARTQTVAYLARLIPATRTARTLGSAALGLTYVAAGWLDLYYHLSLAPWDAAAAVAILRAAGGTVTDLPVPAHNVAPTWTPAHPRIFASNGALHTLVLDQLAGA